MENLSVEPLGEVLFQCKRFLCVWSHLGDGLECVKFCWGGAQGGDISNVCPVEKLSPYLSVQGASSADFFPSV